MRGKKRQAAGGTSRHHVREAVQAMIVTGQHQPGTKLRQQELATQFGVNQGVVREALLELAAYGLVEVIDNRGVYVSSIDNRRLLESFQVRAVHEGLAARLCCDLITRADIRALEEIVERMYALSCEGRPEEMDLLDRKFHVRITELSGNSMLVRLQHHYWVLGKFVRGDRDPQIIRSEHIAVLKAIEAGYADEAERLMRKHLDAGRAAIAERMQDRAFKPHWVA